MPITDEIADRLTTDDLLVDRWLAEEERRIEAELNALNDGLVASLKDIDPTEPVYERWQRERHEKYKSVTREQIKATYDEIERTSITNLITLGLIITGATVKSYNAVFGGSVFKPVTVSRADLREETNSQIISDGQTTTEWWRRTREAHRVLWLARVAQGMDDGLSLTGIVRDLRGTADAGYRNGLIPRLIQNARVVLRTARQSIVNQRRWYVYNENADVVRGVQAINPLDSSTSNICRARAGAAWTLDGYPFPGYASVGNFPGNPPWHVNCRTVMVAIVKSARALKNVQGRRGQRLRKELDSLPEGQRMLIDGKPASNQTFASMLKKKTKAEQEKILGPGRYELWEKGQISMTDLIDQRGRPLTLKQLREEFEK